EAPGAVPFRKPCSALTTCSLESEIGSGSGPAGGGSSSPAASSSLITPELSSCIPSEFRAWHAFASCPSSTRATTRALLASTFVCSLFAPVPCCLQASLASENKPSHSSFLARRRSPFRKVADTKFVAFLVRVGSLRHNFGSAKSLSHFCDADGEADRSERARA